LVHNDINNNGRTDDRSDGIQRNDACFARQNADEVAEQLETRNARAAALQKENISEYFEGEADAFEFAIKIVKEGGVE